jgi:hypothetical protein
MKNMLAAVAVALAATTGAALAQSMDEGLTMLETAAKRELTQLGLTDVDVMTLNLNQLALIKTITASSDYGVNEKAKQVQAIIANQ